LFPKADVRTPGSRVLLVCGSSIGIGYSSEIAISRVTGDPSRGFLCGMVVVQVQGKTFIECISEPKIEIPSILRSRGTGSGSALIFIMMVIKASHGA
jgi:hypothetical protein